MSNPSIVTIIGEYIWQKVATDVTAGFIHRLSTTVYYYQTYRLTGEAAPTNPVAGTIPEEAARIFDNGNQVPISSNDSIDIYILCANNDSDITDNGKIRVDV